MGSEVEEVLGPVVCEGDGVTESVNISRMSIPRHFILEAAAAVVPATAAKGRKEDSLVRHPKWQSHKRNFLYRNIILFTRSPKYFPSHNPVQVGQDRNNTFAMDELTDARTHRQIISVTENQKICRAKPGQQLFLLLLRTG